MNLSPTLPALAGKRPAAPGIPWPAIEACWVSLAADSRRERPDRSDEDHADAARRALQTAAFLHLGRQRGLLPADSPWRSIAIARRRLGPALLPSDADALDDEALARATASLSGLGGAPDVLGHLHQGLIGRRLVRSGDGWQVDCHVRARRAGGVYYTPDCVTQYMVEQVLGRPCDGSSRPEPPSSGRLPKIVDPACGCGAFLLAAYRRLLTDTHATDLDGRRAVLRRIHGVDLDGEAVLIARRSLWLEMMDTEEGTPPRAAVPQGAEFLAETIRSGDAIAGPILDADAGTFDVVLANPPYRRELGAKELLARIGETEFGRRWRSPRMDLWYYFVHRGLDLLAPGGTLAFIVNSYWTAGRGAEKLAGQLRRETRIDEIFDLDRLDVFPGVSGRHMILRVTKGGEPGPTTIRRAAAPGPANVASLLGGAAPLVIFQKTPEQLFRDGRIDLEPPDDRLLAELVRATPLGRLGRVRQGIAENPATINPRTNRLHGQRWRIGEGVFSLTPDEAAALELSDEERALLRPYHDLCDLGRYRIADAPSRVLIYSTARTCPGIDACPALRAHFARFRPIMDSRRETRRGVRGWWQLHWPREASLWPSPKIISVQMARRPAFAASPAPCYVPFSTNVFVPAADRREHLYYFAAVLNSRLLWAWYRHHAKRRGIGLEINGRVLAATPIREIDFSDSADRRRHDRLVELVGDMMKRPDDEIDRQIDAVVCELYGVCFSSAGSGTIE
jgi:adenine-specific DNA-methyltransferase